MRRTLHYFLAAIEEVLELPPDPGYVEYLAAKLKPLPVSRPHLSASANTSTTPTSRNAKPPPRCAGQGHSVRARGIWQ